LSKDFSRCFQKLVDFENTLRAFKHLGFLNEYQTSSCLLAYANLGSEHFVGLSFDEWIKDNKLTHFAVSKFHHLYIKKVSTEYHIKNNEKRCSRVPRLSDTRYSAKATKGKWRYASSKARLKCVTYPRSQYMVMWAEDSF